MLAPPLNECLDLLEKCEIDPAKVRNQDPNLTEEDANAIVNQNCKNLERVCDVVFDYIFKNQKRLPLAINDLCSHLANELAGEEEAGAPNPRIDTSLASFQKVTSQLASADSARPSEVHSIAEHTESMDKVIEKVGELKVGSVESIASEPPTALSSNSSELHLTSTKIVKYTIAEKVVGSFLFLRFIVPGTIDD